MCDAAPGTSTDLAAGPWVIKVGGSLLTLNDLRDRIQLVLQSVLGPVVLVVGGGAEADRVREVDAQTGLSPELAHQLAVHAMSRNARALALTDERLRLATSLPSANDSGQSPSPAIVLDIAQTIEELESRFGLLPRSWRVTSDSIAAWLAWHVNASLLLLKSVDLSDTAGPGTTKAARTAWLRELQGADLVDAEFPKYGATVRHLAWVNLRASTPSVRQAW